MNDLIAGETILTDDDEISYVLAYEQDKTSLFADLYWEGLRIGYIQAVICKGQTMLYLGDIKMYPPSHTNSLRSWFKPFQWRRQPKSFLKRGLGSKMLEWFKVQAKSMDVEGIYGTITRDDFANNPNLPNWYRQHGFEVEEEWDGGEFQGAKICLPF